MSPRNVAMRHARGVVRAACIAAILGGCGEDVASPGMTAAGGTLAPVAGLAGTTAGAAAAAPTTGGGGAQAVAGGPAPAPAGGAGGEGPPVPALPSDPLGAPDAAAADPAASDAGAPATPAPVTCPAAVAGAGVTRERIDVGGVAREFLLQIPTGYTGDAPLPLVVDFHPLFGSGTFQQTSSGYQQLAEREGFLAAWPDGLSGAWDIGPCCVDAEDEAFARALVARVEELACVDPKRVYAAGYSMGGGMSHFMACNAADVFAAVAPAAFDLVEEMPCAPSRPISVLMFRGTADFIVPYAGGASTPPNGYPMVIHFLGAEGSFERWAELDGCAGTPTDTGGGCRTYDQCAAGVEVTLCTATGGGHVTGDAELGWAMFQRQPMP